MEEIKNGLGKIGLGVITNIGLTVFKGFVFTKLWLWFLIPLGFFGINLIQSIGIMIVVSFLKGFTVSDIVDNEKVKLSKTIITSFVVNTLFLFTGFIYSLFM